MALEKIKGLIKKSPKKTKEEIKLELVGKDPSTIIPTGRSVYYIVPRKEKEYLLKNGFKRKLKNRNARFAFTEDKWLVKATEKTITVFQKKPDKVWIKTFK